MVIFMIFAPPHYLSRVKGYSQLLLCEARKRNTTTTIARQATTIDKSVARDRWSSEDITKFGFLNCGDSDSDHIKSRIDCQLLQGGRCSSIVKSWKRRRRRTRSRIWMDALAEKEGGDEEGEDERRDDDGACCRKATARRQSPTPMEKG